MGLGPDGNLLGAGQVFRLMDHVGFIIAVLVKAFGGPCSTYYGCVRTRFNDGIQRTWRQRSS